MKKYYYRHVLLLLNIISLPGKSLFKYFNESNESNVSTQKRNNNYKKITADDLNQFLKEFVDKYMHVKIFVLIAQIQFLKRNTLN